MQTRSKAVWGLLGLAAACAAPEGDDGVVGTGACTDSQPSVIVGAGDGTFVGLNDDDPVTFVFGPQGGWHVDLAGSVSNMNQEVSVSSTLTLVSDGLQIAGDQPPEFRGLAGYDDEACAGEFWGSRAAVDDVVDPPSGQSYIEMICSFEGEAVDVSVTVEDLTTGKVASDSVRAVVQLGPAARAACQ